jgi:hypothetical protein
MDKLTARIDVATKLAGQEKVPPLIEAEISKESYTPVNFDLWKNVVHVVVADEAQMKAAHDILGLHTSDAARDLARMENKQIAEVAEANITEKVAGTPYSDWGARTGGVSDTDPMLAIQASMAYVAGQGYPPDFLAMHPTAPTGGQFTLPGWPTVAIFVDWALTETPTASIGPIVGSRAAPALVFGEGPDMAARYRNDKAGYDAYIIRDWMEPKVVLDAAADMICT